MEQVKNLELVNEEKLNVNTQTLDTATVNDSKIISLEADIKKEKENNHVENIDVVTGKCY